MADNMSADITITPRLSGIGNTISSISATINNQLSMVATVSIKAGLLGSASVGLGLIGKAGINVLAYDDPIDYLMFENGVRMRSELDQYIKTETSP
jgi:hypothetical protein